MEFEVAVVGHLRAGVLPRQVDCPAGAPQRRGLGSLTSRSDPRGL